MISRKNLSLDGREPSISDPSFVFLPRVEHPFACRECEKVRRSHSGAKGASSRVRLHHVEDEDSAPRGQGIECFLQQAAVLLLGPDGHEMGEQEAVRIGGEWIVETVARKCADAVAETCLLDVLFSNPAD